MAGISHERLEDRGGAHGQRQSARDAPSLGEVPNPRQGMDEARAGQD